MKVGKGAIQGDCLSPLLFNMCIMNYLIKCIEDERTRALGYHYCNTLKPRYWFHFADDTALVTATEEENQMMRLNVFQNGATGQGYKLGRISAKLLVSNTMEEGRLNINHT